MRRLRKIRRMGNPFSMKSENKQKNQKCRLPFLEVLRRKILKVNFSKSPRWIFKISTFIYLVSFDDLGLSLRVKITFHENY